MKSKITIYLALMFILLLSFSLYIFWGNSNSDEQNLSESEQKKFVTTQNLSKHKTDSERKRLSHLGAAVKKIKSEEIQNSILKNKKNKLEKVQHFIKRAEKKLAEIEKKLIAAEHPEEIQALQRAKQRVSYTISKLLDMRN